MPDIGYGDEWKVVSEAMNVVSSGVPFVLISLPERGQLKVSTAGGLNQLRDIKEVLTKVLLEINAALGDTKNPS